MGTGPCNLPGVSSDVLYKNEKFKHSNNEFLKNAVSLYQEMSLEGCPEHLTNAVTGRRQ